MKSTHTPGQLLVVDDNRVNRLLLTRALEQHGHRVLNAENGKVAMGMLKAQHFDVLLLDIDMPEMNGFEVLEELLKDDNLRDLPVIMTSASDELDRVVKCIEMGAEDYLVKPLNPVLLRARVNASVERNVCATSRKNSSAPLPHRKWRSNCCAKGFRWEASTSRLRSCSPISARSPHSARTKIPLIQSKCSTIILR